jgi:putative YhbY family RNA-binding protein
LTPAERKALKARAHALNPILQLGGKGLSEAVLAEIGRALDAHELIKVRAGGLERDERDAAMATLCARLGAEPVQHIGKVLVLYRQKPAEEPGQAEKPDAPEVSKKRPRPERKGRAPATRSGRRGSRSA